MASKPEDLELTLIVGEMRRRLEDYDKILEKFGSLEAALGAEKVVHCGECARWCSDKQYCNRPCVGKIFCPPTYYCGSGVSRERVEKIADKFERVNPISPVGLRAALKVCDDAMNGEDSNEHQ